MSSARRNFYFHEEPTPRQPVPLGFRIITVILAAIFIAGIAFLAYVGRAHG